MVALSSAARILTATRTSSRLAKSGEHVGLDYATEAGRVKNVTQLRDVDTPLSGTYPPPVADGTPRPIRYGSMAPIVPDGPLDLPSLVVGDAPLELDIGFGRGRSLITRARQDVSRIVGIEIKAKWSHKVEERRVREGLTNARALCADARELLARSGPDGSVSRAFVHFPDPWWKKRHTKRRVVSETFLDTLARLLEVGGQLLVQTDVEDRAAEYEASLAAHPAFDVVRVESNPFGAESNREIRAAQDGLPVHRLLATRVEPAAVTRR